MPAQKRRALWATNRQHGFNMGGILTPFSAYKFIVWIGGDFLKIKRAVKVAFDGYIKKNKTHLAICSMFLLFGICTGSVYCVSLSKTDALGGVLGDFSLLSSPRDATLVFFSSLANSLQLAFFIWLCGMTKLGTVMAPFILALKGFACAFCVSALISLYGASGFFAASIGIMPQMLFMFMLMQIFCVAAINFALYSSKTNDRADKRRRLVSYIIFSSLIFALFVICSLIESYISPYLLRWALKL